MRGLKNMYEEKEARNRDRKGSLVILTFMQQRFLNFSYTCFLLCLNYVETLFLIIAYKKPFFYFKFLKN